MKEASCISLSRPPSVLMDLSLAPLLRRKKKTVEEKKDPTHSESSFWTLAASSWAFFMFSMSPPRLASGLPPPFCFFLWFCH